MAHSEIDVSSKRCCNVECSKRSHCFYFMDKTTERKKPLFKYYEYKEKGCKKYKELVIF